MPNGQSQLDAAARQMGFQNYAQYSAYQAHQRIMRQGNPNVSAGGPAAAPQQPPAAPPQNWLQRLMWGLGGGK